MRCRPWKNNAYHTVPCMKFTEKTAYHTNFIQNLSVLKIFNDEHSIAFFEASCSKKN